MEGMKRLLALAFAAALVAAPWHVARASDSNDAFAAKLVAVMEQMASLVDANKNDCNAMGDKLDRFITDHDALFKEAKAREAQMSEQEKQQFEARYHARLQGVVQKLQRGLSKCITNPKVSSALQKVPQ